MAAGAPRSGSDRGAPHPGRAPAAEREPASARRARGSPGSRDRDPSRLPRLAGAAPGPALGAPTSGRGSGLAGAAGPRADPSERSGARLGPPGLLTRTGPARRGRGPDLLGPRHLGETRPRAGG